jgi:glycosyltransferase involved in cell wall biosynthesis
MSPEKVLDISSSTCCIVPMYNEEQVISQVVTDLRSIFPHVICIDDGSDDKSAAKALEAGALVLRHSVNIGQGAALSTGFSWVQSQSQFSYVVTFDADGQHQPEDALRLVTELVRKQVDVVFASRFLDQDQATIPLAKRLVLKTVTKITKSLTDVELSDAHNGLRALTVDATKQVNLTQNGMAHATQFVSLVLQANLKYVEIPVTILYTPYSRSKGQSLLNSINIALDLIWG